MNIIKTSFNLTLVTLGIAICSGAIHIKSATAEKSVPEIGWSSRISSMGLDKTDNIGNQYKFECQPASEDLVHAPIWGTKFYTINSGICSSAVHSAMISPEEGGQVTIKLLKGKNFYTGSKKNKIASEDHSKTNLSFTFVGKKIVQKEQHVEKKADNEKRESSGLERILMDSFQRGVERSIEKTITDILN